MIDASALKKILARLSDSSGDKPSGWKAFWLIIGAVILVAVVAIPVIIARRKAAKVAHERDVLIEEKQHLEVSEELESNRTEQEELKQKQEERKKAISELDAKLEELEGARKKFQQELDMLLNWDSEPPTS